MSEQTHLGNIRAELARHNKNQGDVAQLLKTTRQAVSRRLLGHVPFRIDELQQIAEMLGIPVSKLIEDTSRAAS